MVEIKNFNNYYITTCGEVISKKTKRKMTKTMDNVGYYWVGIVRNDGVLKKIRIHRLMAISYLNLNYMNKKQNINHINSNKKDNYIRNLEIVNNSYNTNEGYKNNCYTTRNKIKIRAYNEIEDSIFSSVRECSKKLNISRKLIPLIINNEKPNNTNYKFEYIEYNLPYWIRDDVGNEFQSCRSCSIFYGFDERRFAYKYNISKNEEFIYKNKKFYKFLK